MPAMDMITYRKPANNEIKEFRRLLDEYIASLSIKLSFQDIENELKNLPGKYAEPSGSIIVAECNGTICGCVALRKIDDKTCEMKRLFVREGYKGKGIGKNLVERIISEAENKGYERMRLDTLSSMKEALSLYRSLEFYEIEPYIYNPVDGTVFMEKKLQKHKP